MAQDQIVKNASSTSPSSWSDLPFDIFYEILSFLPMLPFYFKLSRVNKAWSGIIQYLIEKAGDEHYLHLNFGYVDVRNMEISNLLHIMNRCKGVKRVTLSNMRITDSDIIHALENTNVETIVMSQCTFVCNIYLSGFNLNFFTDSKKALFEKLKSIVIFNSDHCGIWTDCTKRQYLLENCETLNVNKISHGIQVNHDEDTLPTVCNVEMPNHEPVSLVQVHFENLNIENTFENLAEFLNRNDLLVGYDTSSMENKINNYQEYLKGVKLGLFHLFKNDKSLILDYLLIIEGNSPSLDPTRVLKFDYQQFSQLYHVQFLMEVIKYAHETSSIKEDMNENNNTYKNCLKIGRRIDKCFKYYQTKSKSKDEMVMWTLFLESGETSKSNKRKNNENSTTNKKRK